MCLNEAESEEIEVIDCNSGRTKKKGSRSDGVLYVKESYVRRSKSAETDGVINEKAKWFCRDKRKRRNSTCMWGLYIKM